LSQDYFHGIYEQSDCPVFPVIKESIGQAPVGYKNLHQHLAYELGLTAQLASLFTVLFIHHETPEYQLQLSDDSKLFMADDSPLLGTRPTSDLIPLLNWNNGSADELVTIGPASAPSFSDARHHLSLLCPELAADNDFESEDAFPRSMDSVRKVVVIARRVLDLLQSSKLDSGEFDKTGFLNSALGKLGKITKGNYAEVYAANRTDYPLLTHLADDLETVRNMALVEGDASDIIQALKYVSSAEIPDAEYPNLAVDQESLLTALSPSQLTQTRSRGWSTISEISLRSRSIITKPTGNSIRIFTTNCPSSNRLWPPPERN